MTEQFDIYEGLYRAVYPPEIMPMFWKENGEISSAVFKEKRVVRKGRKKHLYSCQTGNRVTRERAY